MKILKLIGVFFAIVIVIIAITFGGTFIDEAMPTIATTSYNDAGNRLSERISEEWKNCKNWNISLYDDFVQEIEQSKASDLITPPHASSLMEQNGLDAADKLCKLTFAEFNKANCSYDIIKTNINVHIPAIIGKESSIGLLPDIQTLKKCWSVYSAICVFGWYDYSEGVCFNSDDLTWSEFKGLYNNQDPQKVAANFLNDDIYKKYLSKISSLKSTLSSENIKAKLYNNRYEYYKEVTSLLDAYTVGAPLDNNTLAELTKTYGNLYRYYIEGDDKYKHLYKIASTAKRTYESELKSKKELAEEIASKKKSLENKKLEVAKYQAEVNKLKSGLSTLRSEYSQARWRHQKNKIQDSIDSQNKSIVNYTNIVNRLTNEYNVMHSSLVASQNKYDNLR